MKTIFILLCLFFISCISSTKQQYKHEEYKIIFDSDTTRDYFKQTELNYHF